MSSFTTKLAVAACAGVAALAIGFAPTPSQAEPRGYQKVEYRPSIGYRVLPGARRLFRGERRTAVRGSAERVGGYSYGLRESFDLEVLPPQPQDFGPYLDQSPVATEGPIDSNPYP